MSDDDGFEALVAEAIRFRDERDWKQFHAPKDLALGLSIEAAELGELFLWKTRSEAGEALGDPAFRTRLAEEMADVQIYLLYLSEAAGIALPDAVRSKIAKNGEKYPVERSRGSAAKYDELR